MGFYLVAFYSITGDASIFIFLPRGGGRGKGGRSGIPVAVWPVSVSSQSTTDLLKVQIGKYEALKFKLFGVQRKAFRKRKIKEYNSDTHSLWLFCVGRTSKGFPHGGR